MTNEKAYMRVSSSAWQRLCVLACHTHEWMQTLPLSNQQLACTVCKTVKDIPFSVWKLAVARIECGDKFDPLHQRQIAATLKPYTPPAVRFPIKARRWLLWSKQLHTAKHWRLPRLTLEDARIIMGAMAPRLLVPVARANKNFWQHMADQTIQRHMPVVQSRLPPDFTRLVNYGYSEAKVLDSPMHKRQRALS